MKLTICITVRYESSFLRNILIIRIWNISEQLQYKSAKQPYITCIYCTSRFMNYQYGFWLHFNSFVNHIIFYLIFNCIITSHSRLGFPLTRHARNWTSALTNGQNICNASQTIYHNNFMTLGHSSLIESHMVAYLFIFYYILM